MFYPKNISGVVRPWEQLPAAAGTYVAGQLVNADGGKVAPLSAAATKTPGYLCMADVTLTEGQLLPVARISKDEVYGFIQERFHGLFINSNITIAEYTGSFMQENFIVCMEIG